MEAPETLSLSGGGSPLENNGTITLGTISYTGTVDQVVAGTSYNNLAFANAGIKTIATGTTVDIAGTWVNNSPTIFEGTASANVTGIFSGTAAIEMGSGTLTLLSTFTNNGTFVPGTGKVFYNGAAAQAVRLIAYYDLELGGAGAKTIGAGTPVTVARNFIVGSATTMSTSAVVDIVGDISGAGTLTVGTGTVSLEGNWLHSGTFNAGTGSVLYDGATQSVADLSYYKLQISNAGVKSLVNNLTVSNVLTINSGTLNLGSYTITLPFTGTPLVNNGVIGGTGTILFSGSGAQTVAGTTYYNLEFSGAGAKTILSASTITVTNNWIVNSPVTMTGSQNADVTGDISGTGAITMGSGIISLEGSWTNNGAFTRGTGTVLFDGANQTIPAFAFNKLELSNAGTKTLSGDISLINVLTINSPAELNTLSFTVTLSFNGTPLVNTGTLSGTGKFIYSGTGTQFIDASTYYDLETGTGARTIADGLTVNVARDWTVTGTTTITGTASVNVGRDLAGTGGLTLGSGTITVGGAWTKTGAFTSGTGTVNYNGGTQTVAALNYYNLHITNAGVKTLAANTTVSKVLTINSGTLNLANFNLTLSGDGNPLVNNATIEPASSTVLYTSALTTTIAPANYYNLNGTGGDRNFATSGTIGIAGVFTPGAGTYGVSGSTVSFNGTAAQTIPAFTFNELILTEVGVKSIQTGTTVNVYKIYIQNGASIDLLGTAQLNITN